MVSILSLWLPILVAAVFVFVVSSIIHMVLGYHKTDFKRLPSEDDVRAALRKAEIPPGDYEVPCPGTPSDRGKPEYQEKMKEGPILLMTVFPRPPALGESLVLWFLYCVIVGIFAAYVAGQALPPGADYLQVFRFSGTTAFAGYALGLLQNSIWFGRSWTTTLKAVFDGLLYALVTAGAFGWLWPD
jgi:hypothetical protein